MRSPLIFFIFVFIIDLLLKSSKDKRKIDEARRKKIQELEKQPRPNKGVITVLKDEIQKETQKRQRKQNINKVKQEVVEEKVTDRELDWDDSFWEAKRNERKHHEEEIANSAGYSKEVREDILRGIIFSEILSEPKSIKNQRRGM
jgi:TolA-binding protein